MGKCLFKLVIFHKRKKMTCLVVSKYVDLSS